MPLAFCGWNCHRERNAHVNKIPGGRVFVNILRQHAVCLWASSRKWKHPEQLLTWARAQKAQTCTGAEIADAAGRGRKVKKAASNSLDASLYLPSRSVFISALVARTHGKLGSTPAKFKSRPTRFLFTFCGGDRMKLSHQAQPRF